MLFPRAGLSVPGRVKQASTSKRPGRRLRTFYEAVRTDHTVAHTLVEVRTEQDVRSLLGLLAPTRKAHRLSASLELPSKRVSLNTKDEP